MLPSSRVLTAKPTLWSLCLLYGRPFQKKVYPSPPSVSESFPKIRVSLSATISNVGPPQFMCNKSLSSDKSTGSFWSPMCVKKGADVPGSQCHKHSLLIFVTTKTDVLVAAICCPGVEGTDSVWVRQFPHMGVSSAAPK